MKKQTESQNLSTCQKIALGIGFAGVTFAIVQNNIYNKSFNSDLDLLTPAFLAMSSACACVGFFVSSVPTHLSGEDADYSE